MDITSKRTTKLSVPHTYDKEVTLVGTLEQLAPDEPTQGRRIALILHGSMGHKDYLFQKRLGLKLPIDSFRFDFTGSHESSGQWRLGKIEGDAFDIHVVAEYLNRRYGYMVDLLVGHSRGSVAAMIWLCNYPQAATRSVRGVTSEDHAEFAGVNTSVVWDRFPAGIDVLTMHGLMDAVVPPFDAVIYAQAYGARSPGTHNLYYVEDADHNFTGMADQVVATIREWFDMLERKELRTGIWHTGVKPKL
ncbi:uncharacterized protein FIBRA_03944 [Fibroporia radiculosa]|uniref:Ectomycorrhiza-regulated esterase n=1 Tax=Fibroporia radiculosa TaxID=599839 RepID=J4G6L6_9APHY|nr:uncharacterized protein FIBRA_03944 [Fibroporia radiculosa]CCM01873.1 predicted protein [Fibroporia radiculosa]